jgi:2-dehydropantoate 2-reductase
MEITIIGSGAIGGVLGAYLARAGEHVLLCDIVEEHVQKMNTEGLTIEGPNETFTASVTAYTPEELLQRNKPLDMVFLCVKAQHTEQALKQILPLLNNRTAIVSFQNGLCEKTISDYVGQERTIGCFVNFSADYLEPGKILYGGISAVYLGELDGRPSARLDDLKNRLSCWGPVSLTNNIWGYLWGKLSYAGLLYATALVDETMAAVVRRIEVREVLMELCSEILEVAAREHVTPLGFDDWEPGLVYPKDQRNNETLNDQLEKLATRMNANKKKKSGIWRDLAVRKRKTEVDYHLVPIIQLGEKYGLRLPLTSLLTQRIKDLENGTKQMSWDHLLELKELYETNSRKKMQGNGV